eukprot:10577862-Heterocapsa_arctica.AAC.1
MLPQGLLCRLLQLGGRRRCTRLPPSLAPPVLLFRKLWMSRVFAKGASIAIATASAASVRPIVAHRSTGRKRSFNMPGRRSLDRGLSASLTRGFRRHLMCSMSRAARPVSPDCRWTDGFPMYAVVR